jgi:AraC family transcriptional regulator
LAKIAVEMEANWGGRATHSRPAAPPRHLLARGTGWNVFDVVCSAGPRDRAFEEQHTGVSIAIVTAGTFQYRSTPGRELMTPGSLLLGNPGQYFECGHEHGVGDRCLSFQYAPKYFEELAPDLRTHAGTSYFRTLRLPPLRKLPALIARAWALLTESNRAAIPLAESRNAALVFAPGLASPNGSTAAWEALSIELAGRALRLANDGLRNSPSTSLAAESRVTRVVRMIEGDPNAALELSALAREAKLSRYHFLRIFQQLTGLTPHQYILRARLRYAATRLTLDHSRVLDIALDSGFGDVSNFNHAFRAEFGVSPMKYRPASRMRPASKSFVVRD